VTVFVTRCQTVYLEPVLSFFCFNRRDFAKHNGCVNDDCPSDDGLKGGDFTECYESEEGSEHDLSGQKVAG
jgi:hypothetical protein